MMYRILILITLISSSLCAQKGNNFKTFNFFSLTPANGVFFKKFGNCSVNESDSSIAVVFHKKGFRDYEINIKKGIVPYSLNYDSDCCTGRIRISKRLYVNQKIIEYNYYSPHSTFKNFDSLNLRSIRIMTKDSIVISYYDALFEVNESADFTVIKLDSLVNKLKPNRTSKYVYVSEGYKLGVYEYDLYKSDVDSSFITGLSMKPNGEKPDVMYVPRFFEYNWWAVESMPCNKISFRVSSI